MKDPNDKHTVDGFADLVTQLDKQPRKSRAGRKPKGDVAMTAAEKQKAYRDRVRAAKEAEKSRLAAIAAGQPVSSEIIDLGTSVADLYRKGERK